jgi:hypothetical protein
MSRNRRSAKAAGSSFERTIADWLRVALDNDFIDRRVKTGSKDCGDVGGVRTLEGFRVMVETKDYAGALKPPEWLREVEVQSLNDGALAGVCIAKRKGTSDPARQYVLMELGHLAALLTGDSRHWKGSPDA